MSLKRKWGKKGIITDLGEETWWPQGVRVIEQLGGRVALVISGWDSHKSWPTLPEWLFQASWAPEGIIWAVDFQNLCTASGAIWKKDALCTWHSREDDPHATHNGIWTTGGIGLMRFKTGEKLGHMLLFQEVWTELSGLAMMCGQRREESLPWKEREQCGWSIVRRWLSCL